MSKRKRKAKAKPPPVVADLFDELPTAPLEPAPRETVARVASSSSGEEGATAAPREPVSLEVSESATLAMLEVLGFPAVHVADLPAPFTLRCELEGEPFVFTSSRAAYAEARDGGVPVFVMRELVALAHAAQNDRMPAHVFGDVLERKRDTPSLVVEPRYAFGGMAIANAEPITCTVGDALERMGIELVGVEVSS